MKPPLLMTHQKQLKACALLVHYVKEEPRSFCRCFARTIGALRQIDRERLQIAAKIIPFSRTLHLTATTSENSKLYEELHSTLIQPLSTTCQNIHSLFTEAQQLTPLYTTLHKELYFCTSKVLSKYS